MRPLIKYNLTILLFSLSIVLVAQDKMMIQGLVTDATSNEPLIGVNIRIKDTFKGTITDLNGNFKLGINDGSTVTLIFSIVGYSPHEIEVNSSEQQNLDIRLEQAALILGNEIVISASRIEESVLQSPVSVETMDIISIRNTPSPNFYDALGKLKGVDISTNSLTLSSINTRGFGMNGNERFVQLIDGIDNAATGINFSLGNSVGISELDLENIELLPGAASALYGPNALNGILLMRSKSPFEYQGISSYIKGGLIHADGRDADPSYYQDYGLRYAKAFNDKFAFKINFSYLNSEDFVARDFRDQSTVNGFSLEGSGAVGTRETNPGYNGVHIYGDDGAIPIGLVRDNPGYATQVLAPLAAATGTSVPFLQSLIPNTFVSRTGYREEDMVDNTAESLKLSGGLHYRLSDNLEAILQGTYGTGSTVYTSNTRVFIDNFQLARIKAELRGDNFKLAAYTTQEDAGDSYSTAILGFWLNEASSPSQAQWFPYYTTAYLVNVLPAVLQGLDPNDPAVQLATHQAARAFADGQSGALTLLGNPILPAPVTRFEPGSPEFENTVATVKKLDPLNNGALLVTMSDLWQYEGMYNFKNQIDLLEIIAGGNFRRYALKSKGALFGFDSNGKEFKLDEFGTYIQVSKEVFNEKLKITGSLRYDKHEKFDGQFSPRLSSVLTLSDKHHIRTSYQTAFRVPTNRDQFLDIDAISRRLTGGDRIFIDKYNLESNPVFSPDVVNAARAAGDPGLLTAFVFDEFKTEHIKTFELGYRGLFQQKLYIDLFGYISSYENFVGTQEVIQAKPLLANQTGDPVLDSQGSGDPVIDATSVLLGNTQTYGVGFNIDANVNTYGFGVGFDYQLPKNFTIGGNAVFNRIDNPEKIANKGFLTAYNTPEWRTNLSFGNREVVKNLGFSINWRYQEEFLWESNFGSGIIPEFQTVDAQVSYKLSNLKSIIKLGGSNIFNNRYITSYGNPTIGSVYYLSVTFDEFLN